jgi:DNA-directed RNA polymerase subunit RPC12/RpoP
LKQTLETKKYIHLEITNTLGDLQKHYIHKMVSENKMGTNTCLNCGREISRQLGIGDVCPYCQAEFTGEKIVYKLNFKLLLKIVLIFVVLGFFLVPIVLWFAHNQM